MRGMMRRPALAVAFALLAATATAAETSKTEIEVVRGPYLVADAKTGQVIEEFDALRPWYPASTTKLMTIYTVFQAIRAGEISLDDEIRYSSNAASQPPSKMGFRPGSTFTLDNAIKMLMVKSANDVAVAVAEAIGGSVEGFAARMNDAAAALGMTRSHFVNPHGLPDDRQVTTARDMALLAQALLVEFEEHRPYYRIHAIEIGGKVLRNYNRLVDRFPGTTGMKTGFICASGYNLVASAERDGRELVAVVFGEYGGKLRNERAAALLDAAFAAPEQQAPESNGADGEPLAVALEAPEQPPSEPDGADGEPLAAALEAPEQQAPEADRVVGEPLDAALEAPEQPTAKETTLLNLTSGESYVEPLDMRPYVCGAGRGAALAALQGEDNDEGDVAVSRLTARIDLGPPIKVRAYIPAEYGEPGFVARLPRPRPGAEPDAEDVLNAFAPTDLPGASAPAEAIGAAAGEAGSLEEVGAE